MNVQTQFFARCCTLIAGAALVTSVTGAQSVPSTDLIAALRQGGHVLVMRHASSPSEVPAAATANRDNVKRERQLDEAGRTGATAMGQALRRLKIPIDGVFTSPTYRARETVTYAQLANPTVVAELGDGGRSMQGVGEADAAWLRMKAAEAPARGNTLLVTHMPNLSRAFPAWGAVADGETVVVRPDGKGGTTLIGRVKIEEWSQLR
jgi:phosphohistidine phosphatase SixA